jgi:hypothetical protein
MEALQYSNSALTLLKAQRIGSSGNVSDLSTWRHFVSGLHILTMLFRRFFLCLFADCVGVLPQIRPQRFF